MHNHIHHMLPKETLSPLQASNLLPFQHIAHGFFGRQGGVSPAPLDSLNGTLRDTEDNRSQNQNIICRALGGPPATLQRLHQVHGNTIHIIDTPRSFHDLKEGDGLITRHKNIPLAVITADCLPILIYEPQAQIIGALHAGWRGIAAGILEKAFEYVRALGGKLDHLHVAIGPHIQQTNYEVGPEVRTAFMTLDPAYEIAFTPFENKAGSGPKYLLSLRALITYQLSQVSIASTWISDVDTYAHPGQFFSCRYAAHHVQNKAYGCQFSAIMQT